MEQSVDTLFTPGVKHELEDTDGPEEEVNPPPKAKPKKGRKDDAVEGTKKRRCISSVRWPL